MTDPLKIRVRSSSHVHSWTRSHEDSIEWLSKTKHPVKVWASEKHVDAIKGLLIALGVHVIPRQGESSHEGMFLWVAAEDQLDWLMDDKAKASTSVLNYLTKSLDYLLLRFE